MVDSAADLGDAVAVPTWVPELRAGVHADVYPVSPLDSAGGAPLQAELVLDRDTVTAGYAEHRPPYEFASLLAGGCGDAGSASGPVSPDALAKIRAAVGRLRKARPAALQRQVLPTLQDSGGAAAPGATTATAAGASLDYLPIAASSSTTPSSSSSSAAAAAAAAAACARRSPFPLQKPSAKSTLEDWFNKLASGGAFSTASLSKAVPLGPAIVRAVAKVLEMMSARTVPTQRAVWYIRIAVLNECVKQIRPDRPAPSPRVFWTRQLCGLLKAEVEAMRAKKHPPNREEFWDYVLDLARWQADEALLDVDLWLERIVACVKTDLGLGGGLGLSPSGRVSLRAAETFLEDFKITRATSQHLVDALLTAIDMAGGPEAAVSSSAVTAAGPCVPGTKSAAHWQQRPPIVRVAYMLRTILARHAAAPGFSPCEKEHTVINSRSITAIELTDLVTAAKSWTATSDLTRRAAMISYESDAKSGTEDGNVLPGPHSVSRLLERLPSSGDVGSLLGALLNAFDAAGRGGPRAAVSFLCAWAVRGPMRNSPLAVPIASTMIAALADHCVSCSRDGSNPASSPVVGRDKSLLSSPKLPVFQHEIWLYIKNLDTPRMKANEDYSRPLRDDYGYFVDPNGCDGENLRVAHLLARLYRLDQFSLSAYMKEVSRLVSAGSQAAPRHLFYISALPEPREISAADSRRALLRRGERAMRGVLSLCYSDESAVQAVIANDVASAVQHGERIRVSGRLGVALASGEEIMCLDHDASVAPEHRVLAVVGFLCACGAPVLAAEWLLHVMEDNDVTARSSGILKSLCTLPAVARVMVFALDNLAPCVAASGNLEFTLRRLGSLHNLYNVKSHDSDNSTVLRAIEHTAASYCAFFAPNSGSGNSRWSTWIAHLSSHVSRRLVGAFLGVVTTTDDAADGSAMISLSEVSDATLLALRSSLDANVTSNVPMHVLPFRTCQDADSCWGLLPDQDLEYLSRMSEFSAPLRAVAVAVSNGSSSGDIAIPPGLGSWASSNTVLGCVILPEIRKKLSGKTSDANHLAKVIDACLRVLNDCMHEHDLFGARPTLVVELIALLCAATLTCPAVGSLLRDLLLKRWVRNALLPRAGAALNWRLRSRLEVHVGRTEDSSGLARLLCESVFALFGDSVCDGESIRTEAGDEAAIIRMFGTVEWGVVEMLLAAVASHRATIGDIGKFGSLVGNAVSNIYQSEQAEILIDMVPRCLSSDQVSEVACRLGNMSIRGLAEGLEALVSHAIQEASPGESSVAQTEYATSATSDPARCAAMRALLPFLEDGMKQNMPLPAPISSMVVLLLRQIDSASRVLQEPSNDGMLQPDLSSTGSMFSAALESRFSLLRSLSDLVRDGEEIVDTCGLDMATATSGPESNLFADCAISLSRIIGISTPLLLPSALSAGISCLSAALERAEFSGDGTVSVARENDAAPTPEGHVGSHSMKSKETDGAVVADDVCLAAHVSSTSRDSEHGRIDPVRVEAKDKSFVVVKLRTRVYELLRLAEVWMNDQQRTFLSALCSNDESYASNSKLCVRAYKSNGDEVDPWYLLEGYGRGPEEEPAIPPSAFPFQGLQPRQLRLDTIATHPSDDQLYNAKDERVVRLKRTYSTYACTTVR